MKRRAVIFLSVLAGLVLASFSIYVLTGLGKVRLRWKFKKGQVLRYEIKSTGVRSKLGKDQSTLTEIASLTVTEADLWGTARIVWKTEAWCLKSADIDYDSRKDREVPPAIKDCAVDSNFTYVVDSSGRVLEVEGLYPFEGKPSLMDWFRQIPSRGGGARADEVYLWLLALPKGRVGPGDGWSVESMELSNVPAGVKRRLVEMVKDLNGGQARIVLAEKQSDPSDRGGTNLKYVEGLEANGRHGKGTWLFSVDAGSLVSADWGETTGDPSSPVPRFRFEVHLLGVSKDR